MTDTLNEKKQVRESDHLGGKTEPSQDQRALTTGEVPLSGSD